MDAPANPATILRVNAKKITGGRYSRQGEATPGRHCSGGVSPCTGVAPQAERRPAGLTRQIAVTPE
jgi:hypothetical protein